MLIFLAVTRYADTEVESVLQKVREGGAIVVPDTVIKSITD